MSNYNFVHICVHKMPKLLSWVFSTFFSEFSWGWMFLNSLSSAQIFQQIISTSSQMICVPTDWLIKLTETH